MDFQNLKEGTKNIVKDKLGRVVLGPLNNLVDENISGITTTIGQFVIRSIRNRWERSISFTVGNKYSDGWMEEALYGILYKYNNIKSKSKLELTNANGVRDGSGLYYRLDAGFHNLKYREYDIMLSIQSVNNTSPNGRASYLKSYQIITYNLDPMFVINFEKDMLLHRNSLLKIKANAPTVNVYQDLHEGDGYTYWEKGPSINKRSIDSIYLPKETKKLIVDTINNFFLSKEYYKKHGIAHNLKILLYGGAGTGKDSIAKMIASEWNRNIYFVTGGKGGRHIPNALTSEGDDVTYPLFIVSDIDKYAFLIDDTEVDLNDDKSKEEKMNNKQLFGSMINALDGIMSGEDRIIIMTTNHIEKFSPVFTRPGRVDLMLEIGYVTPDVFRKYIYNFYGQILPAEIKLKSDKLSIADLQFDTVFLKLPFEEIIKKHLEFEKDNYHNHTANVKCCICNKKFTLKGGIYIGGHKYCACSEKCAKAAEVLLAEGKL